MRKTPLPGAVLALAVLVAIVGCARAVPVAHATSAPAPTFTPIVFASTFGGAKTIVVPAGANSASITLACSGDGSFTLDGVLNKGVAGLGGSCDRGIHRYRRSVAPGETLNLEIQIPAPGSFVIETRFSADRFVTDRELSEQCSALVPVGSDLFNAEEGFTLGALTLEQWRQKVSDASKALQPVLSTKPNILTAQLGAIHSALITAGIAPGAFVGPSDYTSAMSIARQVCEDNGSALYLTGDYGG